MKRSTRRLSVAICLLFAATSQGATNPNIGANGLFLMGYTKREDPEGAPTSRTGFYAQRMEVQMDAALDSTLHSTLTLALPAGENPQLIEGYLSARFRSGLMLQAGRFYVDFGQHNALHAHQFPFLDMPLVLERFFFTESLNEVGIGLSKALPLPWRSSWSAQIVNGDNPLWVSKTDEDFLLVTRLINEWEYRCRARALMGSFLGRWPQCQGALHLCLWRRCSAATRRAAAVAGRIFAGQRELKNAYNAERWLLLVCQIPDD
jgi:hypothetical protein